MATIRQSSIDRGLEAYLVLVQQDARLEAEFEASISEFYPHGPPAGDPRETLLAARRHLEWFVLERHSPALLGVPSERWLERWEKALEVADDATASRALLDSFTGIFEVTEVRAGEGAWLRDLAGLGEYAVAEPESAELFEAEDLIVGRLFPIGDSLHHVSRAAGFFRNADLRSAIQRDLDEARASGVGNILHLSQRELESMFWGATAPARRDSDVVGEARRALAAGGLGEDTIERVLASLAASPWKPERLVHGAGDTLGDVLDELAFETDVNLERVRRTLLDAWPVLAGEGSPASPGSPESNGALQAQADSRLPDPRAALQAFEEGRAAGGDLDVLFNQLERELGLDGDASDDDDEQAPDFPGVVGAMVEEFLWELKQEGAAESAQRFGKLRDFGAFGAKIGVFEELSDKDLRRFATFWVLEHETLKDADEARDLVAGLAAFCAWADDAHGLELSAAVAPALEGLSTSLPRVVAANSLLAAPAIPDAGESLGEV